MSYLLWKFYFEDDADSFCHLLGQAGTAGRQAAQKSYLHEPSSLSGSSPLGPSNLYGAKNLAPNDTKNQRSLDGSHYRFSDLTLTRADINRRDGKGLTLLLHAVSSEKENGQAFAIALLAHPLTDVHLQDLENGWNALHRAFYFGNISIARAILERESQDAIGPAGLTVQAASLIKTKDWEGNGPWDILTATIKDRTLRHVGGDVERHSQFRIFTDDDEDAEPGHPADSDMDNPRKPLVPPHIDLDGDELFTFGSNKNFNLGLNNQDDRHFPERVKLNRPNYLFRKFHEEHLQSRIAKLQGGNAQYVTKLRTALNQLEDGFAPPAIIRSKPISIQDVQMSKFHTAILTNDTFSNLYLCGHGLGGRLGVSDEKTHFNFVCVEDFGSQRRKIIAIALGQDHTLAVTDQGDLFAWGSNSFGQLGLGFSKNDVNTEEPACLSPRKIFGPLKRETIIGVAASRIHSVAHTANSLYTFGKNEGQLGIVDAQSGSLKFQPIPRRVAPSRISSSIVAVSAIDRATVFMLENHEIHVCANYGMVKLQFPLDQFANPLSEKSNTATRYDNFMPIITKIACGGDTICALSNAGEIFAVTVEQRVDPSSSATVSTTKPNKIRQGLSPPSRIWSLKKGHMSARDVAVDQDGSVIISTEAGSVWRRVHRATFSKSRLSLRSDKKSKEFKITRVPGLTRVIAVRSSAFGAYCAIRSECDVTKSLSATNNKKSLWKDLETLLPFKSLVKIDIESGTFNMMGRGAPRTKEDFIRNAEELEKEIVTTLRRRPSNLSSNYDVSVKTSISDLKVPVHSFILASRSRVLREIFALVGNGGTWSDEVVSVSRTDQGHITLEFNGVEFMAIIEFVLYNYTDTFIGLWMYFRQAASAAHRYRQIRLDLLKMTSKLDLRSFDSAVRKWATSAPQCLDKDMEMALLDFRFFESADASVQLQDGEIPVHSGLWSRRCPFFEGLFEGSAAGKWLDERRSALQSPDEKIAVDLSHIEMHVFQLVLRHVYADTGPELFDDIISKDLDEFLDLILDVLSAANELMLDELSRICQKLLGRHVTTRNVCQLLNAVAPCAITWFKDAALEFICLNLEALLSAHLLDELDEDLLYELDEVVQNNQLNSLPFAKSGRAELLLHEKHPELAELITKQRYGELDRMRVHWKYSEQPGRSPGTSLNAEFEERQSGARSGGRKPSASQNTPKKTPKIDSRSPEETRIPKDYFGSPSTASSFNTPSTKPIADANFLQASSPSLALPSPSLDLNTTSKQKTERSVSFSETVQENAQDGSSAWGNLPLASGKLGMKEIMEQASSARTSSLSLGFAATQEKAHDSRPATSQTKLSQKERRRQQQQQREFEPLPNLQASSSAVQSSSTPSSPWRTVPSKSKAVAPQSSNPMTENVSSSKPNNPRSSTTPQLTMRQTIANSPATPKETQPPADVLPQTPKQQHALPTPQPSSATITPPKQPSASSSKPIEVQSIRHIPRAATETSPSSHRQSSLADILSQQQAEKMHVKEAVAKRSLQEIQQEQEFQEWWDQESQRVMAEEAAAARAASNSGNRGRGRGGRGRGGSRRGKGKVKEDVNSSTSASHSTA